MIMFVGLLAGGCEEIPSTRAPELTPFEQAVESIGGREALMGLELLQIESRGSRRVDYESPQPGGLEDVSSYTTTYMFDLLSDDLRTDTGRVCQVVEKSERVVIRPLIAT